MQVERLVRKMLLKLSSTAFPITLNPAYQLPGGMSRRPLMVRV